MRNTNGIRDSMKPFSHAQNSLFQEMIVRNRFLCVLRKTMHRNPDFRSETNGCKQSTSRVAEVLVQSCSHIHTQTSPLLFQASQKLWAEPMKKKKRMDPSLIAAREQKKIKKIDKEIKRLTRFGRILKPVAEIEMTNAKLKMAEERKRPAPVLTFEESEDRALLYKEWARRRTAQWHSVYSQADRLTDAQDEALEELREESEELYKAAIQPDMKLIPLYFTGPKRTPPISEHSPPDGEYVDTTRKY